MPKIIDDDQTTETKTPQTPKGEKKTGKVKGAKKVPTLNPVNREVIYPQLEATICQGEDAVSVAKMKELLGWETEKDYIARRQVEEPNLKTASLEFGDDYLLIDHNKQKVRCWNNARNRPFKDRWAKSVAQDILNRQFAGELTIEGGSINGESFIVGRTGIVLSGQHRGVGLILAAQMWADENSRWRELWPTEPVLETLMVTGVSEDPKVVRTLDNVMPRALSDVIFTSGVFADTKLDRVEQVECSKMLDTAVDFLWKRTGAERAIKGLKTYQTHSQSLPFVERHKKIVEAVKHVFEENRDHVLSNLGFGNRGVCAATMYLMGACESDIDEYQNADERSEDYVSMKAWPKAKKFWTELATPKSDLHKTISRAMAALVDEDKGRLTEKVCLLAKAWHLYYRDEFIPDMKLKLKYRKDENGNDRLADPPGFDGIDEGPEGGTVDESEPKYDPKEIEKRAEEVKRQSLEATRDASKATKKAERAGANGTTEGQGKKAAASGKK